MKIKYNSPVILSFAILSFMVLMLKYITFDFTNELIFSTKSFVLWNPLSWITLLTHSLGHSDFSHYIGNMMTILLIGPLLEEKYGSKNLLIMMCITSIVIGLVNHFFFPNVYVLGASGIAFMLILLASLTSFRDKEIPLTFIFVIILYLSGEIFNGMFVKDNIAQFSHIIGGICGAILGYKMKKQ